MGFWKKLFGKKDGDDKNSKWNAMWEMWDAGEIESPYNELLTYDSEIQNGGHLQFFLNRALRNENIFSVMSALRETLRIHRETGMHLRQQAEQDLKRYFRMVFMDLLCRTAYREAAL